VGDTPERAERSGHDIDALYRAHAHELVRFATGLVGPSDAADVVADAVLRVWRSGRLAHVDEPRSYLFRAVVNEARMHHRGTLRRRAREARAAVDDPSVAQSEPRPEVLEAVARLSVRQRAVVVLVYWDDLDERAVARQLGISTGSVRRHLARARVHLRGLIGDGRDA
jgi:RNA polymerase sigma factor (sigma-70 family)